MIDPLILVKDSLSKLIGESGTNKLNPGKLIAKLTQLTDLSAIEIQQTLLCLSNQNIITGIGPRGIPHKKVGWKNPSQNPAPASRLLVKKVASQVSEDQEVRDIFIKHHKQFNGLKEQDVERILNNLLLLKDTPFTESTDRYIHSARHFLGGSKVLDKLNRLTKELGIELPKDTATYYVLTAGKPNASQVLFIENPRVFNYLKSYANRYSTLLISSYGYGLTLENFADKLENYSLIACPTDNEPQVDLRKALTEKRILYWGDIDRAGIGIYESLQQHIQHLELSAIYKVMLEDVAEQGHPYHSLFDKNNQKEVNYRLQESRAIIEQSQDRALDQEYYCHKNYIPTIFTPLEKGVMSDLI